MFLASCTSSAQLNNAPSSSLNGAELSALLGDFSAVTIKAPMGAKAAVFRVSSQLDGTKTGDGQLNEDSGTLSIDAVSRPLRIIVGLAGDPTGRGTMAPTLSLPGVGPCKPVDQLVVFGVTTPSYTTLNKECLGMGNRTRGAGGGGEIVEFNSPLKLNTWIPVYRWYFLAPGDTTNNAFKTAKADPRAQIVWWAYFSDDKNLNSSKLPKLPLYQPGK